MVDDRQQLDGVEQALLDLRAADRAGLESGTPVEADALVRRPVVWSRRRMVTWLTPVAATIVLSVTVGAWMLSNEIASIRERVRLVQAETERASVADTQVAGDCDCCYDGFWKCITGPSDSLATKCSRHDYDSDGDVDLADFGAYQVACVRPVRTQ